MTNPSPSRLIAVSRRGHAVELKLCRPEKSNAYTQEMLGEMGEAIEQADRDCAVRVIVVTGTGDRAFCGGADKDELATRDWRSVLSLASARMFRRLRQSRCVTIAALNGVAVGGGLELALSCDLRFCVPDAKFWLPEPALGLLPAAGGTELLPQIVGPARAKELILGGAVWDAAKALEIGLVTEVVARPELPGRVQFWIDRISSRDADALRFAKLSIDLAASGTAGSGMELVAQALLVQRGRTPSEQDA